MLRCVLTDVNDRSIAAPHALSMDLDIDEGVPADSLYAVFPYFEASELKGIRVYNGDKLIFTGVVDEEERLFHSSGRYLKISSRSLASRLIDNEAAPCGYDHPSARLICERYVEPFGISLSDGDDSVYFGEQTVLKGASCWSVLKNFCSVCYSSVPRVSGDGVLYLRGIQRDERVCFGNGDGCIRYTELSEKYKRCEEISAVNIKTADTGGYRLPVSNSDAVRRGVVRERYLNAVMTENPMRCAEAMIRAGKAKAYTLRLRCPGCLSGTEGFTAEIKREDEVIGDLYISALRYRLSGTGEYTDVILKRRLD